MPLAPLGVLLAGPALDAAPERFFAGPWTGPYAYARDSAVGHETVRFGD